MKNTCDSCLHRDIEGDVQPCATCCAPTNNWTPLLRYDPQEVAFNKRALDIQVAGNHYKDLAIQPVEYIHANNIGYFEGNVIKYVSR